MTPRIIIEDKDLFRDNYLNIDIKHILLLFSCLTSVLLVFELNELILLINLNIFACAICDKLTNKNKRIPRKKLLGVSPLNCIIVPVWKELIYRGILYNFLILFSDNILYCKIITSLVFAFNYIGKKHHINEEKIIHYITWTILSYLFNTLDYMILRILLHMYVNLFIIIIEYYIFN